MVSVLNVVGVIAGERWPVEVTDTVPLMVPLPPRAPVRVPLPTVTAVLARLATLSVTAVPLPISSVPPLMLVLPV